MASEAGTIERVKTYDQLFWLYNVPLMIFPIPGIYCKNKFKKSQPLHVYVGWKHQVSGSRFQVCKYVVPRS